MVAKVREKELRVQVLEERSFLGGDSGGAPTELCVDFWLPAASQRPDFLVTRPSVPPYRYPPPCRATAPSRDPILRTGARGRTELDLRVRFRGPGVSPSAPIGRVGRPPDPLPPPPNDISNRHRHRAALRPHVLDPPRGLHGGAKALATAPTRKIAASTIPRSCPPPSSPAMLPNRAASGRRLLSFPTRLHPGCLQRLHRSQGSGGDDPMLTVAHRPTAAASGS